MEPADGYTARFDVVSRGSRRRVTVGAEVRDRDDDGAIPTEAWFHGEEYRLDVEEDADETSVYVRRL
jgi:hypothetical protein